ncbi:MAG: serine/threonine protein kinase [Candidatus Xenobia bacterium]
MPFKDDWLKRDGLLGGRYQVDRQLKEGPFSITYKMVETATGKPFILRVIPTSTSPAEHQEFASHLGNLWSQLSTLSHPRLPRYLDAFAMEGYICLLREYVEGGNLLQLIDDQKTLEEERVRDWAVQLCDLLYLLHNKGIVLGALRPQDVYIDKEGRLKIADYGPLVFVPPSRKPKMVKEWLGGLAAPEVLRRQTLRPSTDAYALGALMHYLLTRVRPRGPSSPFTMLAKYREDVGRDMNRMVMRMLQFSADGRFEDMAALKAALLGQQTGSSAPIQVDTGMSANPASLMFRDVRRGNHPVQRVTVWTAGADDTATVKSSSNWLRVTPDRVQGESGVLMVTVEPGELRETPEQGEIVLAGHKGRLTIPVTANVEPKMTAQLSPAVAAIMVAAVPLVCGGLAKLMQNGVADQVTQALAEHVHKGKHVLPHPPPLDPFLLHATQAYAFLMIWGALLVPVFAMMVFTTFKPEVRVRIWLLYAAVLLSPLILLTWLGGLPGPSDPPLAFRLLTLTGLSGPFAAINLSAAFLFTEVWWLAPLQRKLPQITAAVQWLVRIALVGALLFGSAQCFLLQ